MLTLAAWTAVAAMTAWADNHSAEKTGKTKAMAGKDTATMVTLASASQLVGLEIETTDDMEAGEIAYLLIDTQSGAIRYALIESDDDLELADGELVAIPFSALDVANADDDEISASVTLAQIAGSPRVMEDSVAEFAEPVVITKVYDYYAVPENDRLAAEADESSDGSTDDTADAETITPHILVARDVVSTVVPGLERASRILGADVRGSGNVELGEIDEIVVDTKHNKIAYVLISEGGFLGIGADWYPVPMETLRWDASASAYVANVSPASDGMRKLPKGDLPTRVKKSELDEFYRSFGLQPHAAATQ